MPQEEHSKFDLAQQQTEHSTLCLPVMEWQEIKTAPFDRDLELAVIDDEGPHALVFACRRVLKGWVTAENTRQVQVHPTHWRKWQS